MKRSYLAILGLVLTASLLAIPAAAQASISARASGQAAVIKADVTAPGSAAEAARHLVPQVPFANNWYAIPRGTTCEFIYASTSTSSVQEGYICSPNGAWCWYQRGPSCDPSSGIILGSGYTCPGYPKTYYYDWTAVADYYGFETYMPRHCVRAAYTS
jgi:hypothetical protein